MLCLGVADEAVLAAVEVGEGDGLAVVGEPGEELLHAADDGSVALLLLLAQVAVAVLQRREHEQRVCVEVAQKQGLHGGEVAHLGLHLDVVRVLGLVEVDAPRRERRERHQVGPDLQARQRLPLVSEQVCERPLGCRDLHVEPERCLDRLLVELHHVRAVLALADRHLFPELGHRFLQLVGLGLLVRFVRRRLWRRRVHGERPGPAGLALREHAGEGEHLAVAAAAGCLPLCAKHPRISTRHEPPVVECALC